MEGVAAPHNSNRLISGIPYVIEMVARTVWYSRGTAQECEGH